METKEVILKSAKNAHIYDEYGDYKILQAAILAYDGKYRDKFYQPITTLKDNSTLVDDVFDEIRLLQKHYPTFSFTFAKFL